MAGKRSIGNLLKNNFIDATRAELIDAHTLLLGTAPTESFTDEELRTVVQGSREQRSEPRVATMQPPQPEGEPTPVKAKGIPNLGTTGKWGGRMRRVTLQKRTDTQEEYCQPVGWNGLIWNVPVGVPVDMPYPWFNSMVNTKLKDEGSDAVSEFVKVPGTKGKVVKVITPTVKDTIPFIDHGDVPGTENLPTSYFDFFTREAKATECFKNKTRSALIGIHNILFEQMPMFAFRDMTNHDIRLKIAMALGGDIEDIMRDEQYDLEAVG